MNEFRIRETGEVITEQELRNRNSGQVIPNPILKDTADYFGIDPILSTPIPEYTNLQVAIRNGVVQDTLGNWVQAWIIVDKYKAPEELTQAIASAKVKKNQEINEARLNANFTAFPHQGKDVACDALSRSDIDATNGYISLFGSFSDNWPGGWKAVDNTYIPITTIDEWKAFYKAMNDKGVANFIHSQQLKAMVNAATTLEAIEAITWDTPTT
jgi:hypothetical protein